MNIIKKITPSLFVLLFLLTSCVPNPKKLDNNDNEHKEKPVKKGYSMIFYRLDNYALVYVNDKLIFDTQKKDAKHEGDLLIDLNEYISSNNDQIKVEGYNAECEGCQNNNYEFVYEIFKDGEGIEYVSEYSNNKHSALGLSMTKHHSLLGK